MGFLKEMGEYIIRFCALAVNKIEIIAGAARLKLEIKKKNYDIGRIKIETGEYVIEQFEKNSDIDPEIIAFKIHKLNEINKNLELMKRDYENMKKNFFTEPGINQSEKRDS